MKNHGSLLSVLVTNGANHNRLLRYARVHLEPREYGCIAATSGHRCPVRLQRIAAWPSRKTRRRTTLLARRSARTCAPRPRGDEAPRRLSPIWSHDARNMLNKVRRRILRRRANSKLANAASIAMNLAVKE